MWDNNSPLQLLNSMSKKLTKENLEKLQLVIDADKYKNSLICGFDLCGMYAPFCRDCKKTSIYPCALAYVNMMKADGMDIEIDARPVETSVHVAAETEEETAVAPKPEEAFEDGAEESAYSDSADAEAVEEPAAEDGTVKVDEEDVVPGPVAGEEVSRQDDKPVKRGIRIAVARRKL